MPKLDSSKAVKLQAIRELIDKCDQMYYRTGNSPLSDVEYDNLKKKLYALDPQDERHTRVGPPYTPEDIEREIPHSIPMGSIENTKEYLSGLRPWISTITQGFTPLMVSLKMDGSSIALYYNNGRLEKALTRGNGLVGHDITTNAAMWQNLPLSIPADGQVVVRGEAMLHREDYEKIAADAGLDSNPRNVGTGIVSRHDGQNNQYITFYAFNVYTADLESADEEDKFEFLDKQGFNVVQHKLCNSIEEVEEYYNSILAARNELPFDIDGLVAVINDSSIQRQLITDTASRLRPKFARAIKFPMYLAESIVTGCNITIGHNGVLNPTVEYKPVRIGGVMSSNANLNNWNKDSSAPSAYHVGVGDLVQIGLAGDIIPKITNVIQSNGQPFQEPANCPFCGSPTTRTIRGKEGAATYCSKLSNCPAAKALKVDHWIGTSKKGVGILDIGDKLLTALLDSKLVSDPADLYTLTVDQIKNLNVGAGKLGVTRARKVIANINSKRHLTLPVFLGALGIELLGRRRVEILQKTAGGRLDTLDQWRNIDNLRTVIAQGLGDPEQPSVLRESIIAGIQECDSLIQKLLNNGVTVGSPQAAANAGNNGDSHSNGAQGILAGKSFCLTGTRECEAEIVAAGGELKSGVSRNLHYLVQKDPLSQSKKSQKADELGVKIISIDFLKKVLSGAAQLP